MKNYEGNTCSSAKDTTVNLNVVFEKFERLMVWIKLYKCCNFEKKGGSEYVDPATVRYLQILENINRTLQSLRLSNK